MVLTYFHAVATNPIAIDLKVEISYEWVAFKVCNVHPIRHANEYPTMYFFWNFQTSSVNDSV